MSLMRGFELILDDRRRSKKYIAWCNARHRKHLHAVAEQAVYLCAACGAWKMIPSVEILQYSPLLMGILGSVLEGLLRHIWHPLNFTPKHLSSITCLDNSSSTAPARTSFNSHGSHKACNILIEGCYVGVSLDRLAALRLKEFRSWHLSTGVATLGHKQNDM